MCVLRGRFLKLAALGWQTPRPLRTRSSPFAARPLRAGPPQRKYARRVLEIFALSRWSDSQLKKPTVYNRNIVLLGDMNVPAMDKNESTYKALVRFGWKPVDYVSVGGSNLGQMVFAPRTMGRRLKARGVFDFDNGFLEIPVE